MFTMTDKAVDKAAELRNEAGGSQLALRVSVQPGGCAGLRYSLLFDPDEYDGDVAQTVTSSSGTVLRLVVDRPSAPYLESATLDYVESLDRIGFVFDNPSATGGCACGDSFC
jgi:iron-sulfur cluster assembly accessory protein